jgi:16S rRNA processing protein RimM
MKSDWQKNYLRIGEIYREHGVKGFCKAFVYSGTDDNLEEGAEYVLEAEDGRIKAMRLEDIGVVGRYFLLKFEGIRSPEEAVTWRKAGLWIAKGSLDRAAGEIYDYEWEGVRILTSNRADIGTIRGIVYVPLKQFVVINKEGGEFYVPYRPEWILNFDRDAKTVFMDLPEGIGELE